MRNGSNSMQTEFDSHSYIVYVINRRRRGKNRLKRMLALLLHFISVLVEFKKKT